MAFIEMMPILRARESLANINELIIANNRKSNNRAYQQLERQATINQRVRTLDVTKMEPAISRAIIEGMGFKVAE